MLLVPVGKRHVEPVAALLRLTHRVQVPPALKHWTLKQRRDLDLRNLIAAQGYAAFEVLMGEVVKMQ